MNLITKRRGGVRVFKSRDGQFRAGWVILFAFFLINIAQGIFMIPGLLLSGLLEANQSGDSFNAEIDMSALDGDPWVFLLLQGGGTLGGIVITLLLWRFLNKSPIKELGFKGTIKDLSFGLLLGAASISVIFIVLLVSGNVTLVNSFSDPKFTVFTLTFLILFILVGFFEEMFFRGYVMATMAQRGNKRWLIYAVSALFFSLVHGTNPNVSIFGLVNILLVGVLFAYMFDATNSLWMPIGYHITWNYFQGNVFGFAVSGTAPYGIYNVDISKGNELLTGGSFGLEGGMLATILIFLGFIATNLYVKNQKPTR